MKICVDQCTVEVVGDYRTVQRYNTALRIAKAIGWLEMNQVSCLTTWLSQQNMILPLIH